MNTGQFGHLVRIHDELMELHRQLKDEDCSTDVLLAACKVGTVTAKEVLGEYKPPSFPPNPEDIEDTELEPEEILAEEVPPITDAQRSQASEKQFKYHSKRGGYS